MKILKITDPPIKGYPDYAYPLSVILNYDYAYEWLYCNYIQLHFDENDIYDPVRFYFTDASSGIWNIRNPLLDYQMIHRDTLALLGNDIIKFIKDAIDLENYIIIYLDEFYLIDRWAYQNTHFNHINFIYGYDDKEQCFYTAGYDKNIQYSYTKISFLEIEQAYINNVKDYYEGINKIYLLKFDMMRKRYEFDILTVIKQLKEYVYAENSSLRYNLEFNGGRNLYFGTDIYTPLKLYLDSIHKYGWNWNLIKPIFVLYEHKKLMALRIKFLEENGYLQVDSKYYNYFIDLAEMYSNIKFRFLKYMKTRKKHIIDEIIFLIDRSVSEETAMLKEMIIELETNYNKSLLDTKTGMHSNRHYSSSTYELGKTYFGKIEITFEVVVMAERLNYLIGFAEGQTPITLLYNLPIQIRLNAEGYFDALNSNTYSSSEKIQYAKKQNYKVRLSIDLEAKSYDVFVAYLDNEEVIIADKFSFQNNTPIPQNIGKICILCDGINDIFVDKVEVICNTFE
jgi:hypothetical protein